MGASWSNNVRMSRASMTTTTTPTLPSGPPPIPDAFRLPLNTRPTPYSQTQTPTYASAPTNTNRIPAFHSSASWRVFFEASKKSNKLVVVDFTATWCGPCRQLEPTLNEYANKYTDVDFVKIDVDELTNVASEFGVQAMPTLILLKNGKQVDKVVGVRKEELLRKIQKHMI